MEFSPERIRQLRERRGASQTAFGLGLLDCSKGYAQKRVSQLENGRAEPTAAERRTLQRMDEGEI